MKVEVPFVGSEIDTNDPSGTVKSVAAGIAGVSLMFGIFAVGKRLYNEAAGKTDYVTEIEVL